MGVNNILGNINLFGETYIIKRNEAMLAMSTLMMPAPTMACAQPIAVGPHKPPEAKLLAIHPAHSQNTPQHQMHAQQQCQQPQQMITSSTKPGTVVKTFKNVEIIFIELSL